MINKYLNIIKSFFKGHERTVRAKKHILASIIIKGVSIVIGFLLVRVTLDYLDQTKYGIWLVLSGFLTWFSFFEIGLGSGLQNKLAESIAVKNYNLARIYVSTTYAILGIIVGSLAVIFFIVNPYINWATVLNTEEVLLDELVTVSYIIFGFFFLTFVLKLINIILFAYQRPAVANSFGPIGNLLALITIYALTQLNDTGSLIYISWALSAIPVFVLIIATIYFYKSEYNQIAPSIKYVNFKYAKDLLSLGFKFFLIQISALIMFQSSNFIITQFYGPAEVTPYNVAYKLFSVLMMGFTIIVAPFRAAFTEAWVKGEFYWIRNTVKKLSYVWIGLVITGIFLFFISDVFFEFWLTKEKMSTMIISNKLKISLLLYFLLFTFGGIYNMFINGVGKITVQMFSLLIGSIIFLPLTFFFIKYLKWGIESVVIASILANFYSPFIAPYQYYKIINKKAHGIWNR